MIYPYSEDYAKKYNLPYEKKDFLNLGQVLNDLGLGDLFKKYTGSGLTTAEQEANAFSHNEAQLAYEREVAADSTKHQREVQDLIAAGINPMLAAGASGGSVHASPVSSVSPSSSGDLLGSVLSFVMQSKNLGIQRMVAEADVKLKEAEANNLNQRTAGQEIQNWIQEHTKELQVESARLDNLLKEKKIELSQEDINKAKEQTKLIVEQQKTEAAKQGALLAESVLKNAQAEQIVQLLPYQKALISAQTENQKAAAALAWAHEAYQRGLIENGYLDSFCREAFASANQAESEAAIAGVKAAIQSGDYSHSAMGYVPVISECATGLSNAFGVIGNVFHGLLK